MFMVLYVLRAPFMHIAYTPVVHLTPIIPIFYIPTYLPLTPLISQRVMRLLNKRQTKSISNETKAQNKQPVKSKQPTMS